MFKARHLIFSFAVIAPLVEAASFDCQKASSKIEKMICHDDSLSQSDSEMSAMYFKLIKTEPTEDQAEIKKTQKIWLSNDLLKCQTIDCIKSAYLTRIRYLRFREAFAAHRENPEKAKPVFQQLAEEDGRDSAAFFVANYEITDDEYVNTVISAIQKGDSNILRNELNRLFLRSGHLKSSNPNRALKLYEAAQNAKLTKNLYNGKKIYSTLLKCAETRDFDAAGFAQKYQVDEETHNWTLAEAAANTDRFGPANPKLILSLVCRGGFVPMELELAVDDAYAHWQKNTVLNFNWCSYAVSNATLSMCSARQQKN